MTLVLDSGALIALERNDRALWAALKVAAKIGEGVVVPSTALAQVWRAKPSQAVLARALQNCVIAGFDPLASRVGELCGKARTSDICDAHVAIVAALHGDQLFTSDPFDLRRLLVANGGRQPSVIVC